VDCAFGEPYCEESGCDNKMRPLWMQLVVQHPEFEFLTKLYKDLEESALKGVFPDKFQRFLDYMLVRHDVKAMTVALPEHGKFAHTQDGDRVERVEYSREKKLDALHVDFKGYTVGDKTPNDVEMTIKIPDADAMFF